MGHSTSLLILLTWSHALFGYTYEAYPQHVSTRSMGRLHSKSQGTERIIGTLVLATCTRQVPWILHQVQKPQDLSIWSEV